MAAHAILVAWNSANSGSVRTRTVSAAIYNMAVQSSSIISASIYREDDRPNCTSYLWSLLPRQTAKLTNWADHRGNTALIFITIFDILLFWGVKKYYRWRNRSKEEIWGRMGSVERANYLAETNDEGNKRLDFKFVH